MAPGHARDGRAAPATTAGGDRRAARRDARGVVGRPPAGAAARLGGSGIAPSRRAAPPTAAALTTGLALASILPRAHRRTSRTVRAPSSRRLVPEPFGVARRPRHRAAGAARCSPSAVARSSATCAASTGPASAARSCSARSTATFDSYGRYFYELFRLPTTNAAWIDAALRVHRRSSTSPTRSHAGTGAVLALPHLGNWDFAGAWLAGQGYPVTVVAEPVEPPELFEWFVSTRAQLGMRVIALSPTAGTEVLRALRDNEVVCLLSDRDLTGDGVEVEFFGERTTMPAGPAMARAARGAPLLPAGCYFRPDGPPRDRHPRGALPTERRGKLRDDVGRVTQDLAHRFEDAHPGGARRTGTCCSPTGRATAATGPDDDRAQ